MKDKIISVLLLFLLLALVVSSPRNYSSTSVVAAKGPSMSPQDYPVKKPRYDYMSTFLSRNTRPLGLKEDLTLKRLLNQHPMKWAIRAGERHILD
ncbi:MAG: hypothetical protein GTO17_08565 [Candidatus Aminicenantes bacterium]|nr:hypothetical protein [Candidatus Aminicenantes bacterium]